MKKKMIVWIIGVGIICTSGCTSLRESVLKGEITKVQEIKDKQSLDEKDGQGRTAIFDAIEKNNLEMVKILINNGAEINVHDNTGNTPLTNAVVKENVEIVKLLVKNKADVNYFSLIGATALHYATGLPLMHMVMYSQYEKNDKVSEEDDLTMIKNFSQKENDNTIEITKVLLDAGADANAKKESYLLQGLAPEEPIYGAVLFNRIKTLKLLLQKGGDKKLTLNYAAQIGRVEIVKMLIEEYGMDKNTVLDEQGRTAITYGIINEKKRVVNYLFDIEANIQTMDKVGESALTYAVQNCNSYVLLGLLNKGENIDIDIEYQKAEGDNKDGIKMTTLFHFIKSGINSDVLEKFLKTSPRRFNNFKGSKVDIEEFTKEITKNIGTDDKRYYTMQRNQKLILSYDSLQKQEKEYKLNEKIKDNIEESFGDRITISLRDVNIKNKGEKLGEKLGAVRSVATNIIIDENNYKDISELMRNGFGKLYKNMANDKSDSNCAFFIHFKNNRGEKLILKMRSYDYKELEKYNFQYKLDLVQLLPDDETNIFY